MPKSYLKLVLIGAMVVGAHVGHSAEVVRELICSNTANAYLTVAKYDDGKCTLSFNPVVADALEQQGTDIYPDDMTIGRNYNAYCKMVDGDFYYTAGAVKGFSAALQGHANGGMVFYYTKYSSRFFKSHYFFHGGECRFQD